ncbi:MAG: PstS family phosphate ABC transporter substrate-binding protein [Phycisphaerales bacterium]|nr:PstS family phosphate ABC transporter substrate-binding protein [Phycisphaerales bacterium]
MTTIAPRTSALGSSILAALGLGTAVLIANSALAQATPAPTDLKTLKGSVRVDGSSTVFPVMEAVAEEFAKVAPGVRVPVGVSGTGGGFKRFCAGETAISTASRPITPSEVQLAAANKIEFIELPIAFDAVSIVVNSKNDWTKTVSREQLQKIFSAGGATRWKEIDPTWPDRPMKVFSPGTDSGTFDYFKEAVIGKDGKVRSDVSVSEDDNVLVLGVEGDRDAIGFFGLAYFEENKEKLRAVPVISASGSPVAPQASTVNDGTYPLSRPLFLYVNAASANKADTAALIDFTFTKVDDLLDEVGYVPLPTQLLDRSKANWKARRRGSQLVKDGVKVEGAFASVYH